MYTDEETVNVVYCDWTLELSVKIISVTCMGISFKKNFLDGQYWGFCKQQVHMVKAIHEPFC
jgi:hypothetical protein